MLFVHEEHGLSVSKACTALRISRSMFLYKPTLRDGSLVITTLLELAERYPRYGCWSVDFMGDALMHGQRA